jgi:outer membrane protein assembly factor BamB
MQDAAVSAGGQKMRDRRYDPKCATKGKLRWQNLISSAKKISAQVTLLWSYQINAHVRRVAVAGDGTIIAVGTDRYPSETSSGTYADSIYLMNNEGSLLSSYRPQQEARAISVSADGSLTLAAMRDGAVYALDKQGNLLWKYHCRGEVDSVSVCADGSTAAAGAIMESRLPYEQKGVCLLYYRIYFFMNSVSIGQAVKRRSVAPPVPVSVTRDGSLVAPGAPSSELYALNSIGEVRWSYPTGDRVFSVSASTKGSAIAVGLEGGKLCLFSKAGGPLGRYDTGRKDVAMELSVSGDGRLIAAGERLRSPTSCRVCLFSCLTADAKRKAQTEKIKGEVIDMIHKAPKDT